MPAWGCGNTRPFLQTRGRFLSGFLHGDGPQCYCPFHVGPHQGPFCLRSLVSAGPEELGSEAVFFKEGRERASLHSKARVLPDGLPGSARLIGSPPPLRKCWLGRSRQQRRGVGQALGGGVLAGPAQRLPSGSRGSGRAAVLDGGRWRARGVSGVRSMFYHPELQSEGPDVRPLQQLPW